MALIHGDVERGGTSMRKIGLIAAVLMLVSSNLMLCADIVVDYKSGECTVDLDGKGEWREAILEMRLSENSIIKTGKSGTLEIMVAGERVAIGSETTIRVSSIVENLNARDEMTWFQKLSDRFSSMMGSKDGITETKTGGVRGALEGEEEITWMGDMGEEDAGSELELGKEQYESGNYGEAISIFKKLIQGDKSSFLHGELAFYLGASLFNSVQYDEALPYLKESIRDRSAYYRESALMYYSFSCFFTGQYDKAIDGFITYREEFEDGELIPYAILMLGKSYKAVGNSHRSVAYFREIEEKYSDSEVYLDAVSELQGL
jgi:tetratricopeptide (TPR) repeat protein